MDHDANRSMMTLLGITPTVFTELAEVESCWDFYAYCEQDFSELQPSDYHRFARGVRVKAEKVGIDEAFVEAFVEDVCRLHRAIKDRGGKDIWRPYYQSGAIPLGGA